MVIDTMVLAYAILNVSEFRDESFAVLKVCPEIFVPDSFRTELVNVVWQWVRARTLPLSEGVTALRDADSLVTQITSVATLWERALDLAVESDHAAYDTLFVALAEFTDTKVITYDTGLQSSFPELTLSPSEFLP